MNDYLALALLSIRGACHFLIFLRVATYTPKTSDHHRRVVGFAAALFAGLNLAEVIRVLTKAPTLSGTIEPYMPAIMFFVLLAVIWAGGNLAKFFPHKLLERLP